MKNSTLYNILSGLGFLIATALAWYYSLVFGLQDFFSVGISVFCISLIYMTSVILYAVHSNKWWNIPCMAYMVFMAFTSALYLFDASAADDLIIWTLPPVMGIEFLFPHNDELINIIIIAFNFAVLFITGSKYFPKEKLSNG